jgi:hypothetical protein
MATETPEQLRRIELGAVLPASWSEEAVQGFASYISGQSNLPWIGTVSGRSSRRAVVLSHI